MQAATSRPATSVAPFKPRVRRSYNDHIFWVQSRSNPDDTHLVLTAPAHCTCTGFKHRATCAHVRFCQDYDRHLQALAGGAA